MQRDPDIRRAIPRSGLRQFRNELQSAQTQFDNAKSEFERAERFKKNNYGAYLKNLADGQK